MALSKGAAEAAEIVRNYDGPKIRVMEVCGTHTHEIFRLGIRQMLPESIELISGPGCPVCVTPVGYIDEAVMLALEKGVKYLRSATSSGFPERRRVWQMPAAKGRRCKSSTPRWMLWIMPRRIRKKRCASFPWGLKPPRRAV